jgi:hypothetical protein
MAGICNKQGVFICKNRFSFLERDTMLVLFRPVLVFIPLDP